MNVPLISAWTVGTTAVGAGTTDRSRAGQGHGPICLRSGVRFVDRPQVCCHIGASRILAGLEAQPNRDSTPDRMSDSEPIKRGRAAFSSHRWTEAVTALSAADEVSALAPVDLECLAEAAYLIGQNERSEDAWIRAHQERVGIGDAEGAARCAFWLAFQLLNSGEQTRGFGWVSRAARLLEGVEQDCRERGYILVTDALRLIFSGDPDAAGAMFARAVAAGERFGDPDLTALARNGQGRALLRQGKTADGFGLLDEVMVAVTTGEVSPVVSGDVYCSMIEACHEVFDLRRAREWTSALNRWCEAQPEVVPYRGTCLVRRSEILQLNGQWSDALHEAERARTRLSTPPGQPALGAAYYQLAELHRLRGEFAKAEDAYSNANQHGRFPQPGLAQLRLAQRHMDAALAAISQALEIARPDRVRAKLLAACAEIVLAADDVGAAREAARELGQMAGEGAAPFLRGLSSQAAGAVLLAEGAAGPALVPLRAALEVWLDLSAPYEAARVRVQLGRACRALGDHDTAAMELAEAKRAFKQLGAEPDLEQLGSLEGGIRAASGLTRREAEVLALVATGKTNRQIATDLFISEKTVARHLSNIFTKLGLENRSAATAYAFKHDLI